MSTKKSPLAAAVWVGPVFALAIGLLGGPSARADQGQTAGRGAASPPAQGTPTETAQGRADGRRGGTPCTEQTTNAFCFWWKDAAVKKEIGLSEEKSRRIDRIYQERVRLELPFAEARDKERERLNQMTKDRKSTLSEYTLQVSRFESLDSKVRETRTVMLYRMFLELTPDQVVKLEALQDRLREARARNGRSVGPSK